MSQKLTSFSGIFSHRHDPTNTNTNNSTTIVYSSSSSNRSSHKTLGNGNGSDYGRHHHHQPPMATSKFSLFDDDEDNVLMDPDWAMDGPNSNLGHYQTRGSFAALAGMSPCLGVPPVDCLFYPSPSPTHRELGGSPVEIKKRRRHFSLEDYQEGLDESSSSNDSFALFSTNNKLIHTTEPECLMSDLNPAKSFMNDLSYTSNLDQLEMGSESISQSLRMEFESLLVDSIQNGNPELSVNFPPDLISVIARHVLQEASDEPYGIKGCILHIQYEGQTALHHLGSLNCDPEVAAKTFELTLTLRQAQSTWGQRMARRFSFSNSSSSMSVSTSYKLVKKRKYRS